MSNETSSRGISQQKYVIETKELESTYLKELQMPFSLYMGGEVSFLNAMILP